MPSTKKATGVAVETITDGINSVSMTAVKYLTIEEGQDYVIEDEALLPYEHIKRLGHGSSGTVEKVRDRNTGTVYARKTFLVPTIHYKKAQSRDFGNEIEAIRSLGTHLHIVSVFATYTAKEEFGLILQPVAEADLATSLITCVEADWSPEDPRSWTIAAVLGKAFGCLLSALAFMHKKRIRHKDIKPQNILIYNGSVVYTDFGSSLLSGPLESSSTEGPPGGVTWRYCAPEVKSFSKRNSKSDVYSLGCVFIETLFALTLRISCKEVEFFSGEMDELHERLDNAYIPSPLKLTLLPRIIKSMTNRSDEARPTANDLCCDILCESIFGCSECQSQLDAYRKARDEIKSGEKIVKEARTAKVSETNADDSQQLSKSRDEAPSATKTQEPTDTRTRDDVQVNDQGSWVRTAAEELVRTVVIGGAIKTFDAVRSRYNSSNMPTSDQHHGSSSTSTSQYEPSSSSTSESTTSFSIPSTSSTSSTSYNTSSPYQSYNNSTQSSNGTSASSTGLAPTKTSQWVWSGEYQDYYRAEYGEDGTIKYEWYKNILNSPPKVVPTGPNGIGSTVTKSGPSSSGTGSWIQGVYDWTKGSSSDNLHYEQVDQASSSQQSVVSVSLTSTVDHSIPRNTNAPTSYPLQGQMSLPENSPPRVNYSTTTPSTQLASHNQSAATSGFYPSYSGISAAPHASTQYGHATTGYTNVSTQNSSSGYAYQGSYQSSAAAQSGHSPYSSYAGPSSIASFSTCNIGQQGQSRFLACRQSVAAATQSNSARSNITALPDDVQTSLGHRNQRFIQTGADESNTETLDPRYRRVAARSHAQFFVPGRIFTMLWIEPAGVISPGKTRGTTHFSYTDKYGEEALCEIRRFVVVRNRGTFSQCMEVIPFIDQSRPNEVKEPQSRA